MMSFSFQVAYNQKDSVHKFIRKLLALPFLPAEHIPAAFQKLQEKATQPQLQELTSYVDDTDVQHSLDGGTLDRLHDSNTHQ